MPLKISFKVVTDKYEEEVEQVVKASKIICLDGLLNDNTIPVVALEYDKEKNL